MSTAASTLLDLAEVRWTELASTRPDLRPAIAMQRSLVGRTIDTVERLAATEITDITLEPALAATKLRAATPVLRGEVLALPVSTCWVPWSSTRATTSRKVEPETWRATSVPASTPDAST